MQAKGTFFKFLAVNRNSFGLSTFNGGFFVLGEDGCSDFLGGGNFRWGGVESPNTATFVVCRPVC